MDFEYFGGLCSQYLSDGVSPELSCNTFSSSLLKEKNGQIAFDCSSSQCSALTSLALCHTETFLCSRMVKYNDQIENDRKEGKVQGKRLYRRF